MQRDTLDDLLTASIEDKDKKLSDKFRSHTSPLRTPTSAEAERASIMVKI